MAGIGFELRKLMAGRTFLGLCKAYGFAGLVSSGPWVLSIAGILLIGLLAAAQVREAGLVAAFQISVTYLMAASLILIGPVQLTFTRYISDRLYQNDREAVLPSLIGLTLIVMAISGGIAFSVMALLFTDTSRVYRFLMLLAFVSLCSTWVSVGVLAGLKNYRQILLAHVLGYTAIVVTSLALNTYGVEGLLTGIVLGHQLIFWWIFAAIAREYPSNRLVDYGFLGQHKLFLSLAATGLCYNLGLWADKLIFWFNPDTSYLVIGPLRASAIYDLPIFLAHVATVPGMAVFLLRVETDFAESHARYYRLIREGGSLTAILDAKELMLNAIKDALVDIAKIQGLTVLAVVMGAKAILSWFGISPLYRGLLSVDVLATGVEVLLLAIMAMLFYFDKRLVVLLLSLMFASANIVFTIASQLLGPMLYGYGFALAVVLTTVVGVYLLSKKLDSLEYDTFMLQ